VTDVIRTVKADAMTQLQPITYSPPCKDLYIYLINGALREQDEALLGNGFLGNWVEAGSSFLFFSRPSRCRITRLLAARPDLDLEDEFHFAYEEWQGGGLEPVRIDPFLIMPPWLGRGPQQGLMTILLDPGVVFGNCHHPTTRACLKALSLAAQWQPLGQVLDLGTGTGILALAAARLGAREVLAVDLNPLCVKTATRNVELNGLTGIIHVIEARAEDVADDPTDLIAANIHYDVIQQLLAQHAFRSTGTLIVSGLMRTQYRDITIRLKECGFHPVREWDHDMTWFTILASRETQP
jgi:ribosomal protein L11 methyltransferase